MRVQLNYILLAVAGLAVGCGGSGGGGGSANPFVGEYVGTWSSDVPDTGTAGLIVGSNGHFSGFLHDDGLDADGTMTGTISSSGSFHGTAEFPGFETSTIDGTVAIDEANHLVGDLTQSFEATTSTIHFDLAKS